MPSLGAESLLSPLLRREEEADAAADCNGEAVDVGRRGLRIAAIFVILAASGLGALLPVVLARQRKLRVPGHAFFVAKFVGTGVIIATAWMHLLEPAADQLGDPCLGARLGDYPWAFGIGLWTVMAMFFVEMVAARFADKSDAAAASASASEKRDGALDVAAAKEEKAGASTANRHDHAHDHHHHGGDLESNGNASADDEAAADAVAGFPPNAAEEHLAHGKDHVDGDSYGGNLAGQLLAIFILEFGVVFHSVFIGLALGTASAAEVPVLLVVLTFHQLFEGLGLGSRLAAAPWPRGRRWLPYALAAGYAVSTPVGIAAGMGARPANASDQKLVNGVFDAIGAGILMYTGLVELLAHEFMFNPQMRSARLRVQLFAFACVLFGVFVMSLLAEWA